MLLHFAPLGRTIEFRACPEMADGFRSIMRGWDVVEQAAGSAQPLVTFCHVDGQYLWQSEELPAPRSWRKRPPRGAFEAVCDFHYYFLDWIAAEHRLMFCVHAGAVEFDKGLVVFPCVQRAGKSTLAGYLAYTGRRVFCDDVLLVDAAKREGIALGLLPRLRLPLPGTIAEGYRNFVVERAGLSDKRHVYLALREGELAPFGTHCRIAAIVILSRESGRRATLQPLSLATAVKQLIDQNFAVQMPVVETFEQLHKLAAAVPRFSLCYDDLAEASALLATEFGLSPTVQAESQSGFG